MSDFQKQSLEKAINDVICSNGGRLQIECLMDLVDKQNRADERARIIRLFKESCVEGSVASDIINNAIKKIGAEE